MIDLLKKHGLVDEVDLMHLMHLEGEKCFYEANLRFDHIHMGCFRCGRIEEFSRPQIGGGRQLPLVCRK
jgi:Fe2+ or Zn2+ uptake regulation protein